MRAIAERVVRRLQEAGHQAFWVGGCVRDLCLGKVPQDYDVATSASPGQVEQLFGHTVPVGRQFGVVVVVEEGFHFEVATFRAEADYRDGRRPGRVEFTHAQADASRRDFTVNGLFYDPVAGKLYDWVGGEADLRARVIRTIGDPGARFAEDHLRLLRAGRFAAQLGFEIEPATLAAVQSMAERIQGVSAERVRDELVRLFRPPHAARGLDLLQATGLLGELLPELEATVGCEQPPEYHPEGSVYRHTRRMLELLPAEADPRLPWLVLLHDVGKPPTAARHPGTGAWCFHGHERVGADLADSILARLRFPRRFREEIVFSVRHHMQFKDAPRMRKSTLRTMLLRPTFGLELELHRLDCLGSSGRMQRYEFLVGEQRALEARPSLGPPLLTGDDLRALGMRPGPALGAMLAEVRNRQLQEELRTAAQARAWVRERLQQSGGAGA